MAWFSIINIEDKKRLERKYKKGEKLERNRRSLYGKNLKQKISRIYFWPTKRKNFNRSKKVSWLTLYILFWILSRKMLLTYEFRRIFLNVFENFFFRIFYNNISLLSFFFYLKKVKDDIFHILNLLYET